MGEIVNRDQKITPIRCLLDSGARVEFKLPEFSQNKTITWTAHVDETTDTATSQYDMIIGTDLMAELKLKIDYTTREIHWDDVTIPMKQRRTVSHPKMTQTIYETSKESSVLKMSEERHNEIITGGIPHHQSWLELVLPRCPGW